MPLRQPAPARVRRRRPAASPSGCGFPRTGRRTTPAIRAAGGARMTSAHDARTRVLIADDEPLARERLRMLLRSETGLEIVAECQNGSEAIAAIQKLQPDLVFLDVQMPGATGFDVIEAVGADAHAARRLRHRLRPVRAARVRRARARLPAQAVRPRALPAGAQPRAPAARTHDAPGDLERRLLALVQDLKPDAAARSIASSSSRAAASSSSAPTRSTGSRRPATTSSCTSAPNRTCSARR